MKRWAILPVLDEKPYQEEHALYCAYRIADHDDVHLTIGDKFQKVDGTLMFTLVDRENALTDVLLAANALKDKFKNIKHIYVFELKSISDFKGE